MPDRLIQGQGEGARADALRGVARTSLIPLGLRAADARSPASVLKDERAAEVAERIHID